MFANTQMMGVDVGFPAGLASFSGTEAISRLFAYELDLHAPNDAGDVVGSLLGEPVSFHLEGRHFNGICSRVSQGTPNSTHTPYRAEVVPWLWLYSLGRNSRVFTEKTVPEIVLQVLSGRAVTSRLSGTFARRPFVLQRNESDFAFVSRLMEEEGIFYFFRQNADGHVLVLGNTSDAHDHLDTVEFDDDGQLKRGESIFDWERERELVAGKVTLWDHSFELPASHLEGTKALTELVQTEATRALEVFDFPGGYAQQFDGVDPGGGDQPAQLQKLFPAATRAASLRAEELAAGAIEIAGASSVRRLTAGATVQVEKRFDGKYLLTGVSHRASRFGDRVPYENSFTCIPDAIPFRPARTTPGPDLGVETAVVVGPPGEEVFADKYARITCSSTGTAAGPRTRTRRRGSGSCTPTASRTSPRSGTRCSCRSSTAIRISRSCWGRSGTRRTCRPRSARPASVPPRARGGGRSGRGGGLDRGGAARAARLRDALHRRAFARPTRVGPALARRRDGDPPRERRRGGRGVRAARPARLEDGRRGLPARESRRVAADGGGRPLAPRPAQRRLAAAPPEPACLRPGSRRACAFRGGSRGCEFLTCLQSGFA